MVHGGWRAANKQILAFGEKSRSVNNILSAFRDFQLIWEPVLLSRTHAAIVRKTSMEQSRLGWDLKNELRLCWQRGEEVTSAGRGGTKMVGGEVGTGFTELPGVESSMGMEGGRVSPTAEAFNARPPRPALHGTMPRGLKELRQYPFRC